MGFFNDVGKFFGGIANVLVPGFSTLSRTGIFGNDLQVMAGGSAPTQPVANAISASPGLTAAASVSPIRPPAIAGGVTSIPTPFLRALVDDNRRLQRGGVYIPPQAAVQARATSQVTPLMAAASNSFAHFNPAVTSTVSGAPRVQVIEGIRGQLDRYRWTDAQGRFHEEFTPPPGAVFL